MSILTREAILKAQDLRRELVEVPEWNGAVCVRSMTGTERDRFEASMLDLKGMDASMRFENFRARLVAMTVIDDDGKLLFSESDVEALSGKNAAALQRVFAVSQRLSGLNKQDVEELTKN